MVEAAWWRGRGMLIVVPACLYLAGAVLLVAGIIGASLVDAMPWHETSWQLAGAMPDTKLYETRLESIGGRATFLAAELTRWLGGFCHGRPLAIGLLAVCAGLALACFLAAHHLVQAQRTGAPAGRP